MGRRVAVTGLAYIHRLTEGYRRNLKIEHLLFSLLHATSIHFNHEPPQTKLSHRLHLPLPPSAAVGDASRRHGTEGPCITSHINLHPNIADGTFDITKHDKLRIY
jgi:hypothetical protein